MSNRLPVPSNVIVIGSPNEIVPLPSTVAVNGPLGVSGIAPNWPRTEISSGFNLTPPPICVR